MNARKKKKTKTYCETHKCELATVVLCRLKRYFVASSHWFSEQFGIHVRYLLLQILNSPWTVCVYMCMILLPFIWILVQCQRNYTKYFTFAIVEIQSEAKLQFETRAHQTKSKLYCYYCRTNHSRAHGFLVSFLHFAWHGQCACIYVWALYWIKFSSATTIANNRVKDKDREKENTNRL